MKNWFKFFTELWCIVTCQMFVTMGALYFGTRTSSKHFQLLSITYITRNLWEDGFVSSNKYFHDLKLHILKPWLHCSSLEMGLEGYMMARGLSSWSEISVLFMKRQQSVHSSPSTWEQKEVLWTNRKMLGTYNPLKQALQCNVACWHLDGGIPDFQKCKK